MREVKKIVDQNKEAMTIPDGIAVLSSDLKVLLFNEAASKISGFAEQEIISKNFNLLFGVGCEKDLELINKVIKEKQTVFNLSIKITKKNGTVVNVLASIHPIIRENRVHNLVIAFRDISEMQILTEKLANRTLELINQRNKLDAIFNSRIEGTFTIDHDWNITSFNSSASKITGFSTAEAIGQKCWKIFGAKICRNGCHMEVTLNKGRASINNELEIIKKDGIKVPIRANSSALIDNEGNKIGAVETFIDMSEFKNLSMHLNERYRYENIIGKSNAIKQTIDLMENVAHTDSTVLITGESGTGKELAARAIHLNSSRRTGPFVALNCSAFVETLIESELFGHEKGAFTGAVKQKPGRFELANNGTLFLDEIGDISMTLQVKLLRVLETHMFERVGGTDTLTMNARIIAATNKDLEKAIKEGKFREDLYYRLNVINVHIPPLRDRMEDIILLVDHLMIKFRERFNRDILNIDTSAINSLLSYDWPGNIRELENVLEHAFIVCSGKTIMNTHLPNRIFENKNPITNIIDVGQSEKPLANAEKEILLNTLNKNMGNRNKTANELNIDKSTLWRKMKKYKII